ncbi:MAG: hypothetical protein AAGA56_14735 [Myxococcota bacterium]
MARDWSWWVLLCASGVGSGIGCGGTSTRPEDVPNVVIEEVEPSRGTGAPPVEGTSPGNGAIGLDPPMPELSPESTCDVAVAERLWPSLHALVKDWPETMEAERLDCFELTEGETKERPLEIRPLDCVSAAAVSEVVTDMRLELGFSKDGPLAGLLRPPPTSPGGPPVPSVAMPVLALGEGSPPVLGAPPNCFKGTLPVAIPTALLLRSNKGSGAVLLRSFRERRASQKP